jgi:hypothetical protein
MHDLELFGVNVLLALRTHPVKSPVWVGFSQVFLKSHHNCDVLSLFQVTSRDSFCIVVDALSFVLQMKCPPPFCT